MEQQKLTKSEYNLEPVYYCQDCLSLKIRSIDEEEGNEYCESCGFTNIAKATIEEWDAMYVEKYHHHYLEENPKKKHKKF